MTSNPSTSRIGQLAKMRVRGQRPEFPVVVCLDGSESTWAARNGMFHVPAGECVDLTPFTDLFVLIRTRSPHAIRELAQRLALTARMVTLFDLRGGETEFLLA